MRRTLLLAVIAAALLTLLAIAVGCGGEGDGDATATTPAAPAATATTAPTSTPAATDDAAALFADNCAGCHGGDGSGGSGPDLRGEDDTGGIAAQIREGGGRMPAFAGELTDAQIEALAAYVAGEL